MSRTHDRAHAALAERLRLARPARHALYAIVVLLVASGLAWLAAHDAVIDVPDWHDELARLAFESVTMKVHAAAGVVALVALGMMLAHHARRGLVLARNRASGLAVACAFVLLAASGYALGYLAGDVSRPAMSVAHWIVGAALVPLLAFHIVAGRRLREHRPRFGAR
jgi:predicted permease